ncbi:MAG TPA: MCP four helix bundle domain-containing protein, partial [Telluria sp.]|nr:MCP four helix bundle domain-containing protein [Telluria sp.]
MFNDMKVGTRLILGFLVVTLLGALVAGIGIRNMGKLNDEAERVYQQELLGLAYIKDTNLALSNLGRSLRNALLASSAEDRKKYLDDAHAQQRLMERNLGEARQRFVTERGKAMLAELDAKLAAFQPLLAQLFGRIEQATLQAPSELTQFMFTTYADSLAPVTTHLNDLSKVKEENAKRVAENSQALYASSRNTMIVLVLLGGVVGLAIGILITRRLTRQLGGEPEYAVAVAERIAAGDLVTHVDIKPGDEHSLLHAMQQMRASLGSIVSQVRNGTHAIEDASSEIAAGNLDLSARTEQQASSLEETASSMEELTTAVKSNADSARQANELAASASAIASQGGAVVSKVVDTMGEINASANKIVDIIAVIDGIAFQTNILAL